VNLCRATGNQAADLQVRSPSSCCMQRVLLRAHVEWLMRCLLWKVVPWHRHCASLPQPSAISAS